MSPLTQANVVIIRMRLAPGTMIGCEAMRRRIPSALAPAVLVPGLIYEALVRARNRLYTAALLRINRLPAPVISIGNITMGGAGKTPLVIYIARTVSALGYSPVVLTRGYGRDRSIDSHVLSPGETVPSPSLLIGDEPALIRRYISGAWMGVSRDRFLTGTILSRKDPRAVFILDDGFQHRKLHRDLDIVILDSSQALASNRMFPRGTLREPLSELRRCDVLVINASADSGAAGSMEKEVRRWNQAAGIFLCKQTIHALVPFHSWAASDGIPPPRGKEEPAALKAYLVSAIGNPGRFHGDVRRLRIDVRGAAGFPDHYRLKTQDWQRCIEEARRSGAQVLIVTEKDAVKIEQPTDFPLMVAVQSTEISDPAAFESVLKKGIGERL
jgi:tetraacyldisaccharide 4'-kinase